MPKGIGIKIQKRDAIRTAQMLDPDKTFEEFLRHYYSERYYSSKELGKLLCVSPSSITSWMPKGTKVRSKGGRTALRARAFMEKLGVKSEEEVNNKIVAFIKSGKPEKQISMELGLSMRAIYSWRKKAFL